MKHTVLAGLGVVVIVACVSGFAVWNLMSSIPDTLPEGEDPQLILPVYEYSNLYKIQGFGWVTSDYFHPGFDYVINDTTVIVSPCDAYVNYLNAWYNEISSRWQVNMELRLNKYWRILLAFECYADSEAGAEQQLAAITVSVGQIVSTNQTLGQLLCFSLGDSHLHFTVRYYPDPGNESCYEDKCPYQYFTQESKIKFEELYTVIGQPSDDWCKLTP
ncbi:MAG: hypothetical protein QW739_02330, partial [Candidatus Odinarchaeota archaeon]